jgi:Dolichyl-phosphate-mannose-protein mannosyltransferase
MATAEVPRRLAWPGLAAVLVAGLGLRLWGISQGLPYAYNTDEADHFVPKAVAMFEHGLDPHYFANPPAFTYLLHVLFAIFYGGRAGAVHTFALRPEELYTLARAAAAVLGAAALWLLYATAARLFSRGVGLLAAAIEAVAFLPVFYAHLALNDVPTLAPLTLSLLGSAGILRRGAPRDYLLAGVGLGLACASKYTAGIVVLPLAAATATQFLEADAARNRRVLGGLALAGATALAGFLIANPYALLDYSRFHAELVHQSSLSAEAQGKLGAPKQGGLIYYLWSLTWGLGWAPALFALGGAAAIWRANARLGWLLVPAPLAFLAFMGLQGRYFGRWLLPIFPILCLLGAYGAVCLLRIANARLTPQRLHASTRHGPIVVVVLATLLVAALLAQGLIFSVHAGLVLSRADTRNLTRAWMVDHIPRGAKLVAEPVSPDDWAGERTGAPACPHYRWCKYASMESRISATGRFEPENPHKVGIENYVTTLTPELIGYYEQTGFCWVLVGSTQYGRALTDPAAVPRAIAYYRALAQQGQLLYSASPYARGAASVAFNFDWSFDYYPLAYHRPGPAIAIYRLHGGRCAG